MLLKPETLACIGAGVPGARMLGDGGRLKEIKERKVIWE